ncbi:MAG TPA: helix-turn-helix transcriptional regulator [Kofleriaceae bacterium]|nr:helix-turn-helix transcriptional regulator [Kofleriaceae bacterium]
MEVQKNKKAIALRFKLAREQSGLTQGQVARRLGWHRPTISAIEAATRSVAAEEIPVFADLYGVSAAWLLCEEAEEASEREIQISLAARGLANIKESELTSLLQLLRSLRAGRNDERG